MTGPSDGATTPGGRPFAQRLTAPGRGAVATIEVHGPTTLVETAGFTAAVGGPLSARDLDRVVFGLWGTSPGEEVVVCRTADSTVEIHCHGGDAAVARILDDLADAGCEIVDPRTAIERTTSHFERELFDTVARATTVRTATYALAQRNGTLRRAIEAIVAACEAGSVELARDRLDDLLAWSHVGLHLVTPWRVVLTGRPNVGKSSLVNALLGYTRSIVRDLPGTTRDVVVAETAFDGWPVTLQDTAGLRDATDDLESAGIDLAHRALAEADVRVVLLDTSVPPTAEDERLIAEWPDEIVVAHKCDLPDTWAEAIPVGALRVSSVNGDGVDELVAAIVRRVVPRAPASDQALPVTRRQVAILEVARESIERSACDSARSSARGLLE